MTRRLILLALALAAAMAGSVALLRHERVAQVDIGHPDDSRAVQGFHPPEVAWGVTGRWTAGDAVVSIPRSGVFATRVRVGLCAHPARRDDQVRLNAGGFDVHTVHLAEGCQTIERPIRRQPADADLTVRLTSATTTTRRDARNLGVFVDAVEIVSGGGEVSFRRASRDLAAAGLLLLSVSVAAWHAGALATGARTLAPLAFALVAGPVAWFLVSELGPRTDALRRAAVWAAGAALVLAASRSRWLRGPDGSPRRESGHASSTWPFILVVAIALAVLFREALVDGRVLSQANLLYQIFPWRADLPAAYQPGNRLLGDVPLVFYPFLSQLQHALWSWTLPLWNPFIFTGQPLLASFQSAVFSPFTLLAVASPLPLGTVVGAVARLLTGAVGFFVFARTLGLSPAARYFCGLAYGLNAFSLVWLEHPLSAVAAWMPWLLWATERAVQSADARRAAGLATIVALVVLAGHPETAVKVLGVGVVYGLTGAIVSRRRLRAVTLLGAAYALGFLLSAIQILPFVEYLQESRALAQRQLLTVNPYFLAPDTMVTALVPDFWGHPVSDDYLARVNRLGLPANYCEQQVYAGAVTWVLAFVGMCGGRPNWRRAFFAASAIASAALIYSLPKAIEHLTALPLLRMTALSRFGLIAIGSAIVLAGFGVDALSGRADPASSAAPAPAALSADRHRARWLSVATLAIGMALAAAVGFCLLRYRPLLVPAGLFDKTLIASLFALCLIAVAVCLAIGRAHQLVGRFGFGAGVCLLIAADLLSFGYGFRTFIPAGEVFPPMAGVEAVRRDPGLFRVTGWGNVLPPNTGMPYHLQDPRGLDAMSPLRLGELLDVAFRLEGSFHIATHVEGSRIIDALNVKYVFGRPGLELGEPQYTRLAVSGPPVFRNNHVFPRAWLTDGYTVLTGNAARRAMRDGTVDLHHVAVLEAPLPAEAAPRADPQSARGEARIRHYRDSLVEIETRAIGARLLVLTDLFYPGWVATIDGRSTPIVRANFAFRAVSVPAGSHVVRFEYRPQSFRVGAVISGAALLVVLVMARPWKRARPVVPAPHS